MNLPDSPGEIAKKNAALAERKRIETENKIAEIRRRNEQEKEAKLLQQKKDEEQRRIQSEIDKQILLAEHQAMMKDIEE